MVGMYLSGTNVPSSSSSNLSLRLVPQTSVRTVLCSVVTTTQFRGTSVRVHIGNSTPPFPIRPLFLSCSPLPRFPDIFRQPCPCYLKGISSSLLSSILVWFSHWVFHLWIAWLSPPVTKVWNPVNILAPAYYLSFHFFKQWSNYFSFNYMCMYFFCMGMRTWV